jgi:hypothetical protein
VIFVGGEFYFDEHWQTGKVYPFPKSREFNYFLNGGQACLRVIGDYLVAHKIYKILLPAYLCPTITRTLTECRISLEYYCINEDFSIDLNDLAAKAAVSAQAIYFINYFGFDHSKHEQDYLQDLQKQGSILVEDNAQAGFSENPIGDFVFNSMRKIVPYDGAYLNAPSSLEDYVNAYRGRLNRRLPLIRQYRTGLSRYLFQNEGDREDLVALFEQAETFYEKDQVVQGDVQERACIEHLDWQGIHRVRRENYAYLLNQLKGIPGVSPIFPALQQNNMPLGLPIFFNGISRDMVNAYLGDHQIGLTIHWEHMHENPITSPQKMAMEKADRILTLTIDQYTHRTHLDYLVEQLKMALHL